MSNAGKFRASSVSTSRIASNAPSRSWRCRRTAARLSQAEMLDLSRLTASSSAVSAEARSPAAMALSAAWLRLAASRGAAS